MRMLDRGWAKQKRRFGQRRVDGSLPITGTVESAKEKVHWSARFGSLAQIGTLLVVTIGYVFTVRPVFQYQQLQEQTAKVQLEKSAAEKELRTLEAMLREQQETSEQRLRSLSATFDAEKRIAEESLADLRERQRTSRKALEALQARLTNEARQSAHLALEMRTAQERERVARSNIAIAEARLEAQLSALDSARWELLLLDITFAWGRTSINSTVTIANSSIGGDLIKAAAANWPEPLQDLLAAVDSVAASNKNTRRIPDQYFVMTRTFITERSDGLHCEKLDVATMLKQHAADIVALSSSIDKELESYISGLVGSYKAKGQRLTITDDFRSSSRETIRIGKEIEVNRRYRDELAKRRKVCDDRVWDVLKDLRQAKVVTG